MIYARRDCLKVPVTFSNTHERACLSGKTEIFSCQDVDGFRCVVYRFVDLITVGQQSYIRASTGLRVTDRPIDKQFLPRRDKLTFEGSDGRGGYNRSG